MKTHAAAWEQLHRNYDIWKALTLWRANNPQFTNRRKLQQALAPLPFRIAADHWLENHKRFIHPRTYSDYQDHLKRLNEFFGEIVVSDITIGHIRDYQERRKEPREYQYNEADRRRKLLPRKTKGAGNDKINKELSTVQQILKEAGLWPKLAHLYQTLPVSHIGSGRALTPDEERRLLEAALNPDVNAQRILAGHLVRLMLRTGCGYGEVSHLRRQDVDTDKRLIHINQGAKNEHRMRTIPLTDDAHSSILEIIYRWQRMGGHDYNSYILPMRANGPTGPTNFYKPMGSIKNAFAEIKKDAHITGKFRIYDLRVTAITKCLASGKVSLHTARKLFGHVSDAMGKRYFKPDMDLMREAVNIMAGIGPPPEPQLIPPPIKPQFQAREWYA